MLKKSTSSRKTQEYKNIEAGCFETKRQFKKELRRVTSCLANSTWNKSIELAWDSIKVSIFKELVKSSLVNPSL